MVVKKPNHEVGTLVYPEHRFNPEELLHFIELRPFSRRWSELKLNDDALFCLQLSIMACPDEPPVIQGTGGLRKLRFSPPEWKKGKSNALRVCYVFFEIHHTVLLAAVYPKSAQGDLAASEKKVIKRLIKQIENALSHGVYN